MDVHRHSWRRAIEHNFDLVSIDCKYYLLHAEQSHIILTVHYSAQRSHQSELLKEINTHLEAIGERQSRKFPKPCSGALR